MAKKRDKPGLMHIGWKEWVSLPKLGKEGVGWIKAKIDTGARTSALHAEELEIVMRRGKEYARFLLHPKQGSSRGAIRVSCPVLAWRGVRSSNGQLERRPVIRTVISLGKMEWTGEVTLANRDQMGFRMLLGRTSLEGRFAVDCGAEFLGPEPKRRKKPALVLGSRREEKARAAELEEAGELAPVKKRRRKTAAPGTAVTGSSPGTTGRSPGSREVGTLKRVLSNRPTRHKAAARKVPFLFE